MNNQEKKDLIESAAFGEKLSLFSKTDNVVSAEQTAPVEGFQKLEDSVSQMISMSSDYQLPISRFGFCLELAKAESEEESVNYHNVLFDSDTLIPDQRLSAPFTTWSLSQLCHILDIPPSYIRRCITDGASRLALDNLNYWKDNAIERYFKNNQEKEFLIRSTQGRVTGVLSSRYSVFDDDKFLAVIKQSLPANMNFIITNQIVMPDMTKARIVLTEKVMIGDEELSVGFDITNSRVGRSSVKIQLLVYRWICTNGMIMGGGKSDLFIRKHAAIDEELAIEEARTLISKLPELIENIQTYVTLSRQAVLRADDLDMLVKNFQLHALKSDKCAENIIATMNEKYEPTRWGFANAITEVAQKYSVGTRETLEAYAGKLIIVKP